MGSLSGRVRLQAPPGVAFPGLRGTSAFGEVRWGGALGPEWGLDSSNSPRMIVVRGRGTHGPSLRLHSEAGTVELERLAATEGKAPPTP